MTRIAVSKFRVWCTVDGKEFQVTSFNTSFEINAIPTAQIAVPVGRNVYTWGRPAGRMTRIGLRETF